MFENSNNQGNNASFSQATAYGENEKASVIQSDSQLPSGRLLVPGYPAYEGAWWQAAPGSKNAGAIYAGVFRTGQDRRGRRRTYRTFPVSGGGLIANIVGTIELLAYFADDKAIPAADRKLNFQIAVSCAEAVYRHLNPRGESPRAKLDATAGESLADLLGSRR
ncbi:hypothetical protein [Aeoliella sp.]|uniref:hypothetical protein n=1 Tax=Aeoliella sp. TaxID=2795800 RepID=UPI003CCBC08F